MVFELALWRTEWAIELYQLVIASDAIISHKVMSYSICVQSCTFIVLFIYAVPTGVNPTGSA